MHFGFPMSTEISRVGTKGRKWLKCYYYDDTKRKSFQIIKPVISTFQLRIPMTNLLEFAPRTYDFTCASEEVSFIICTEI